MSFTFKWPKGPQEVIVTGTFDDWSKSLPLVKQVDGSFELTAPLPATKVLYKYIVDGEWQIAQDQRVTTDEAGIDNNYVTKDDLVDGVIPESGLVATAAPAKTAVLPSSEGVQTTLGEPGIQIPANKDAFTKFEEPRPTVVEKKEEPKKLTQKEKRKLKRTQHKMKKSGKSPSPVPEKTNGKADAEAAAVAATASVSSTADTAETTTQETAKTAETKTEEKQVDSSDVAPEEVAAQEIPGAFPIEETHESVNGHKDVAKDVAKEIEDTEAAKADVNEEIEQVVPTVGAIDDKKEKKEPLPLDKNADLEEVAAPAVDAALEAPLEAPHEAQADVVPVQVEESQHPTLDPAARLGFPGSPAASTTAQVDVPVASPVEEKKEKEVNAAPVEEVTPKSAKKDVEPVVDEPVVVADAVADVPTPSANNDNDSEIVLAQGPGDAAAALALQEGSGVTVEEIKPTESEAQRLKEEANIAENVTSDPVVAADGPVEKGTVAGARAKQNAKDTATKKKSGISRFFRKIFKGKQ